MVTQLGKMELGFIHRMSDSQTLEITLKSRDITLPAKVYLVKAMLFPGKLSAKELMLLNCGAGKDA